MKAKAEIAAMFTVTVITPLQRCLEQARPCGVVDSINAKQTIAIAVKYPMRSAAVVISSVTLPQFRTMRQKQKKSCALHHTRDCGRNGIIPGPLVTRPRSPRTKPELLLPKLLPNSTVRTTTSRYRVERENEISQINQRWLGRRGTERNTPIRFWTS